nr:VC1465 family Xer recombination activation factor [Nitrosomonas sp.]
MRETRILAGLTRQQVADMLRVSLRTVQYWERGVVRIPYAAFRLLRIMTGYELPFKAWEGWMLLRNQLISPEGKIFTPGDLYPLTWMIDKARMWDEEYRRQSAPVVPLKVIKGEML